MALDGLSLANIGIALEMTPKDISQQAEEASKARAEQKFKEIEELERQKLDPDKENNNGKHKKRKQKKHLSQKAYVVEVEGLEEERNDKILALTAQHSKYKVIYNSNKEVVEITHATTGRVEETLSLEELKSFIMKVKNPLGVIVDRKI